MNAALICSARAESRSGSRAVLYGSCHHGSFFFFLILQIRLVWQTAQARCPLGDILHHLFTSAPGMKNHHVSCSEEYFQHEASPYLT